MPHNVGIERIFQQNGNRKTNRGQSRQRGQINRTAHSRRKSLVFSERRPPRSSRQSFVLKSECPERFEAFVESFYAEYNPSTPTETALVDTMATARWRLIRMSNLEAAIIDHEYWLDPESARPDHPARATLAYRRATTSGRSIEMMNRAETRLQNQFNSAFDRLRLLKAAPK